MKKAMSLLTLFILFGLTVDAEAGFFRRRRSTGSNYRTNTYDYQDVPVVSQLPEDGATKIKNGWHYEFQRHSSYYGEWVPTHRVGGNSYDNYYDYDTDYPSDGDTRYKDGLHWTFDAQSGKWISEWYRVR